MSAASEIVAILAELNLLSERDPDALARRDEILAAKHDLVERLRAGEDPGTTNTPSRDDGATMPCPVCRSPFTVTGRRRYCSDACRRTAWARRHQSPPPLVVVAPGGSRRPHTVYECNECGQRALGEQRCEDCGVFMHRVGLGGPCPSCDEPVAAGDLIEVIEKRR